MNQQILNTCTTKAGFTALMPIPAIGTKSTVGAKEFSARKSKISKPKMFLPRPSYGWAWLVLMAVIIFALAIVPALAMGLSSSSMILATEYY